MSPKSAERSLGAPAKHEANRKLALLTVALLVVLLSDLARLVIESARQELAGHSQALAWASWIGELPTAAEVYGGEATGESSPASDSLEDDDDDDEELDASASNEYPDGGDSDESYEDAEDYPNGQESRPRARWSASPRTRRSVASVSGLPSIWADIEGWRGRSKRDIEDRIVLASRRAAARQREGAGRPEADDFAIDDGDEDAWVHDGVDDIHIDPETKRAASELSQDEKSVDAEYEPQSQVLNRTRVTTISEVIPIAEPVAGGGERASGRESRAESRFAPSPREVDADNEPEEARTRGGYLPAAYLSMDQLQRLLGQQQRPLAAATGDPDARESDSRPPGGAAEPAFWGDIYR